MIEGLKNWAMTLGTIAVLGSICEMVIPDGSFQKYVRLAIGLILILALLSPIMTLFDKGIENNFFEIETKNTENKGKTAVEEAQKGEVISLYKKKLQNSMEGILSETLGDEEWKVKCVVNEGQGERFGEIERVEIYSKTGNITDAKDIISKEFGINEKVISARVGG